MKFTGKTTREAIAKAVRGSRAKQSRMDFRLEDECQQVGQEVRLLRREMNRLRKEFAATTSKYIEALDTLQEIGGETAQRAEEIRQNFHVPDWVDNLSRDTPADDPTSYARALILLARLTLEAIQAIPGTLSVAYGTGRILRLRSSVQSQQRRAQSLMREWQRVRDDRSRIQSSSTYIQCFGRNVRVENVMRQLGR